LYAVDVTPYGANASSYAVNGALYEGSIMLPLKYATPTGGSLTLPAYKVAAETEWKTLYSFADAAFLWSCIT
jgi:hypothetical protein